MLEYLYTVCSLFVFDEDYSPSPQMKLVFLFVAVMLLSCFQPIAAQGGKVLRMCQKKFSRCSSTKSRNNAKCCGRAWTVSHQMYPRRAGTVEKKFVLTRIQFEGDWATLLPLREINFLA